MEVRKAGFIPYTEKQFREYKENLACKLIDTGLSCDAIINDSDAKLFIDNYVNDTVTNEKLVLNRTINGISLRFANMDIHTGTNITIYPIINEYKGHHLMKTYFFRKINDTIIVDCVEVVPNKIII